MNSGKTVRVLITTFLVTVAMWISAHPLAISVKLFSTPEALALGRSGTVAPDESLPVTLTPKNNVSAQGSAMFPIGVTMYASKVVMTGGTVVNAFNGGKSRVLLMVKIPRDGWYIINCVTTGDGSQAHLMTAYPLSFFGSPPAPVTVGAWDYRNRPKGMYVYPALVELKAGQHFFYWTLEAGTVEFLEANILQAL